MLKAVDFSQIIEGQVKNLLTITHYSSRETGTCKRNELQEMIAFVSLEQQLLSMGLAEKVKAA